MKIIIDRFEGDFAVCEMPDKRMVSVPKCLLEQAKEGDVIAVFVDREETEKRKKHVDSLLKKLI